MAMTISNGNKQCATQVNDTQTNDTMAMMHYIWICLVAPGWNLRATTIYLLCVGRSNLWIQSMFLMSDHLCIHRANQPRPPDPTLVNSLLLNSWVTPIFNLGVHRPGHAWQLVMASGMAISTIWSIAFGCGNRTWQQAATQPASPAPPAPPATTNH